MNIINIGSYGPHPADKLSNFGAQGFFFRGVWLNCRENGLQATKKKDAIEQLNFFGLTGKEAKKLGSTLNWQETGLLYWQGKPMSRFSEEYQQFLDELFDAVFFHNPHARQALLDSGTAELQHTMGKDDERETILTVKEFVSRLYRIRQQLCEQGSGSVDWMTVERPGYLGAHREERHHQWTEQYGADNWRLAWKVGETFVDYLGMCTLYEDAYYAYLTNNPDVLRRLIADASDIYDDAPSNVHSRFDYLKQETGRTHVQDIAIRRCLIRMGVWFKGDQLVQIRDRLGVHPLSIPLSPGQVPFHRLDLIVQSQLLGKWWKADSAESFYQSNKVLQVRI